MFQERAGTSGALVAEVTSSMRSPPVTIGRQGQNRWDPIPISTMARTSGTGRRRQVRE